MHPANSSDAAVSSNESGAPAQNPLLFEAVLRDDVEQVKTMLNGLSGAIVPYFLPEQVDEDGNTLLHVAAKNGCSLKILELILKHPSVKVDIEDRLGRTPLHLAAFGGHLETARSLINAGADIDTTSKAGCTPLYFAVSKGQFQIVQLLLSSGANPNKATQAHSSALMVAAFNGDAAIVKSLLNSGAEPNLANCRGCTALHIAAEKGYDRILDLLLTRGGDVYAKNADGKTPKELLEGHKDKRRGSAVSVTMNSATAVIVKQNGLPIPAAASTTTTTSSAASGKPLPWQESATSTAPSPPMIEELPVRSYYCSQDDEDYVADSCNEDAENVNSQTGEVRPPGTIVVQSVNSKGHEGKSADTRGSREYIANKSVVLCG